MLAVLNTVVQYVDVALYRSPSCHSRLERATPITSVST